MKSCPYCAEQIQDAAIKCRYCGETLTEVRVFTNAAAANHDKLAEPTAPATTPMPSPPKKPRLGTAKGQRLVAAAIGIAVGFGCLLVPGETGIPALGFLLLPVSLFAIATGPVLGRMFVALGMSFVLTLEAFVFQVAMDDAKGTEFTPKHKESTPVSVAPIQAGGTSITLRGKTIRVGDTTDIVLKILKQTDSLNLNSVTPHSILSADSRHARAVLAHPERYLEVYAYSVDGQYLQLTFAPPKRDPGPYRVAKISTAPPAPSSEEVSLPEHRASSDETYIECSAFRRYVEARNPGLGFVGTTLVVDEARKAGNCR